MLATILSIGNARPHRFDATRETMVTMRAQGLGLGPVAPPAFRGPRPKPLSGPGRPLSLEAVLLPPNDRNRDNH